MKMILMLLAAWSLSILAEGQIVTISVNGAQNEQVIINGLSYQFDKNTNPGRSITLNTLKPGKHILELVRINNYNPNDPNTDNRNNNLVRTKSSTTFTVKEGYDIAIVIANNGIVQVKEKRITDAGNRVPFSDEAFTTLLRRVQSEWRNNRKITAAQSAFTDHNNYFTANQARQIIQSVTGENSRLSLAKLSYSRITDQGNFVQVYNLLSTQPTRDELVGYIRGQGSDIVISYNDNYLAEMGDHRFNALVQEIQRQWHTTGRANAVREVFSNETNYFTTSQVRKLVELVDFESARLELLKLAYGHVTDAAQYVRLIDLLDTDAAKSDLQNFINAAVANGGLVNYNLNQMPMGETQYSEVFTKLLEQVRTGTADIYLNNLFGGIGTYLSSQQASQLISVVEGETSRLSLSKAAYKTVTDPENFLLVMNQLLQLQTSREELNSYAYTYKGM